eukprot:221321-Rhodomonas_salina.1
MGMSMRARQHIELIVGDIMVGWKSWFRQARAGRNSACPCVWTKTAQAIFSLRVSAGRFCMVDAQRIWYDQIGRIGQSAGPPKQCIPPCFPSHCPGGKHSQAGRKAQQRPMRL